MNPMSDDQSELRTGAGPLPRIALLTDGMYPYFMGGMQRHSRLLAENLARAGVPLTVFHTAYTRETIEQARVGVDRPADPWSRIDLRFVMHPQRGRYPGHYLRDCWRYSSALLAAFMADPPPADFIYAQGLAGLAFVRARQRGVELPPVAVNAHGYHMFQASEGLRGWLVQRILRPTFVRMSREADFVFTFSHRVRDIVTGPLRIPAERILEVPNAIDDSWIVATPQACAQPRRFLFIGRHDRLKGLPELHRAIEIGSQQGCEFHFVGPIPQWQQVRLRNCTYHGAITDTRRLQECFDRSDVLLCPSHAEGMPTVILEALARGLAIIATDVGAVCSMVDASNGIVLVQPDPAAIAAAIKRLCDMPDEALKAMKRASLDKAPRFGWRAVTAATITAVETAIRHSSRICAARPC